MGSPYFTLCEVAAPAYASVRISQRRLEADDLNCYGSGRPLVLKAELEVDGLSVISPGARAAHPGKP